MKIASMTEVKKNLRALIDRVTRGASVLIVDRGKPVSRLEPVGKIPGEVDDGRLQRLVRAGLVCPGRDRLSPAFFKDEPPRTKSGVSAVDYLIQERREGR